MPKENKIEEIRKSFDTLIETLWEKPKADVFYIQNYAWDWVEEALRQERWRVLGQVERITERWGKKWMKGEDFDVLKDLEKLKEKLSKKL